MPVPRTNERSGTLIESHRGYDPRLWVFYGFVILLLGALASGLFYQQLLRTGIHLERETVQSQRRVVIPGPRGNLYDRDGRLLVGNRARFAVTLHLDELRTEFRHEFLRIRRNYREADDQNIPSAPELERIARISVVEGYLGRINRILGTQFQVNTETLERHYRQQRILPYLLLDDLQPAHYARLLEQLPVTSPLQLYTSSLRDYPHTSLAAHTLGYVAADDDVEVDETLPGSELRTFKMRGTVGRQGLEAALDPRLQGQSGGAIYRVNPAGYRLLPPLEQRRPVQGADVVTSLDLDLQLAAERTMTEMGLAGAAVALDVATGEVLVLASKPDYDLNSFTPRLTTAVNADIQARGAWMNRATQGLYPPGSTFKVLTSIAGLRSGHLHPDSSVECTGTYPVGGRVFVCNNHRDRGTITFPMALEKSCNTFFYDFGLKTGIDSLAAEARRFGLDRPTGIELPYEATRMFVPDPAWKLARRNESWFSGDTANVSIGQGDLALTPLQMACFIASFARNETLTHPTLLHDPDRPRQHSPATDLPLAGRAAMLAGMEAVTTTGTGRILQTDRFRVPGLRIAGKTGTAQKRTPAGTLNFAWFIGFAPIENPRIAIAIMMEGDTPGEDTGGGRYAAPVAGAIFKAWAAKTGRFTPPPPAAPSP
ncbi:peptidoglycan glycosyltransferase [Verrucomicrobia bacterium IMCC26134]|nr:peptidoglycan glycosyltransferase [Verrucomicrobia bacterium IMCC26134]